VPIASQAEISLILREVKETMPDATHVCYAYRLTRTNNDQEEFSTDAGEPGGSAGSPMLNVLRQSGLVNVVAWVARYYGGTKLGIPGLISAYGDAVHLALENVELMPWVAMVVMEVTLPYPLVDRVKAEVEKARGVMVEENYHDAVILQVSVPRDGAEALVAHLRDLGGGRLEIVPDGD
jgi:uncharacterized YigZ family protein